MFERRKIGVWVLIYVFVEGREEEEVVMVSN
jgi:hypothetical protein